MKKIFSITTCLVYLLLLSNTSCGQIENTPRIETPKEIKYETQLIVPDIEIAWGLTFLPNGDILYTEKKGELIIYSKGKKLAPTRRPLPADRLLPAAPAPPSSKKICVKLKIGEY